MNKLENVMYETIKYIKREQINELINPLAELKEWGKNSAKLFKRLFSQGGSGIFLIFIILSFLTGQTKTITFPLSDSNNFYTKGAHSVSIDSSGNVSVDKLEIIVTDEKNVSNYIKSNNYIKIIRAIDKVSGVGVPIKIKGKFAYLNNEMYFDTKITIKEKYYSKHGLKNNSNGMIKLERELTKYVLNLEPSGELSGKIGESPNFGRFLKSVGFSDWEKNDFKSEIQMLNRKTVPEMDKVSPEDKIVYLKDYKKVINELGWLKEDLIGGIIQDGKKTQTIALKWNLNEKNHDFDFWSKDSFDLNIEDKRFHSLIIKWNEWKEAKNNTKLITYDKISLKSYVFNESTPFFTDKIDRGTISSSGTIKIDKIEKIIKKHLKQYKNFSKDSLKIYKGNYIKENSMRILPFIVDNISNQYTAVNFEGKVSYDGEIILFSESTIFTKDKYITLKLKDSKNQILRLKPSDETYFVNIKGSESIDEKSIININYDVKILSNYSNSKINTKIIFDQENRTHFFKFWTIEPFRLEFIDNKIGSDLITYTIDDLSSRKRKKTRTIKVRPKPFNLNVKFIGERSKNIRKVSLSSIPKPGITISKTTKSNGEIFYSQFYNLNWNDSPFIIQSIGNNTYVSEHKITSYNDFNKTVVDENDIPVLHVVLPAWSIIKTLSLTVIDSLNNPVNGVKVKLIDSSLLPDDLKLNNNQLTQNSNIILFENIYDWKNISFSIINNKLESELININDPIVNITGGRNRIDCVIKLSNITFK